MRLYRNFRALAATVAISFSTTVLAEGPGEFKLELRSDFNPKAVQVEKKDGVWFPNEDAEYLLKLRTETVPELVAAINDQQKTIAGLDLQLKLTVDKDRLQDEKGKVLEKTLQDTRMELEKERRHSDIWYNNKTMWAAVGFVGGVILTAYITRSVNK